MCVLCCLWPSWRHWSFCDSTDSRVVLCSPSYLLITLRLTLRIRFVLGKQKCPLHLSLITKLILSPLFYCLWIKYEVETLCWRELLSNITETRVWFCITYLVGCITEHNLIRQIARETGGGGLNIHLTLPCPSSDLKKNFLLCFLI